ncbi:unnamed protein product [Rotaria magnacalcarata]|uniref:SET domain-containing protein n=1 Tax=Rotaria magnacalcarata TaxID=392030 RepID=A0A819LDK2_9BILA|nr:unnamed protein product [Rotaria magnacalcarata]CAF3960460.1 unnamed protein product [Rotaria magnacalcarata]
MTPKLISKSNKAIITSTATVNERAQELESSLHCSNSSSQSSCVPRSKVKSRKFRHKLPHSNILAKLFIINKKSNEQESGIYSTPVVKSIVLGKHEAFINQTSKTMSTSDDLSYYFIRTNLQPQMQHRMISLIPDPFSDKMDRMETSRQLKINLLRINHIHLNSRLPVKIISTPIWTHYAVHVVIQDENSHCLRLSIYNWSYVMNTRQIKSYKYIQECLTRLLPINSCIVVLDPWLKMCHDGQIALRCESPNTHLLMIDFETGCSTDTRTDVEQLRQWGNLCYQADDNLGAIEFYTYGLRQIDEQQEKELECKGKSVTSKTEECEQHRIRLLSNRCACYLRERHAALALADTSILLSINELSNVLASPKTTAGKLLFRCLSAHLHLGLFDKVESLIKSHKLTIGSTSGENVTAITLLERELARLRDENIKERYDLQGMLGEQISFHKNEKPSLMFIDLSHYHVECNRNDLFEVRQCLAEEITRNGYPKNSYGIYALKNIEPGTLLVVEQPFASIDNRVIGEQRCHSINFWPKNEKISIIDYCNDDILRLLNEVEKQLLIGNTSWITFDKIKLMQPIRRWLIETKHKNVSEKVEDNEISDSLGDGQMPSSCKKHWQKQFLKHLTPPTSYIPWRTLFETQQQNPFRSKSTVGWYPLGSMFNHSCSPNCLWYLIGDYLFIYVCASNIRCGDELTISYCPLWISSLNERTSQLRQFGITSCRCLLCSYDRSNMPQYESELKTFSNLHALSRQKNLSRSKRFSYLKKLKEIYEFIKKKFRQRSIGFINEFVDLENLSHYFQHKCDENNHDDIDEIEIETFLNEQESSFLQRLSRVCRLTIKDLPKIGNPMSLFGTHMQLLAYHLEQRSTHEHTCELEQWNRLLECLYEIYTFKCHTSTSNMKKILNDHNKLFTCLLQTQSFLQNPTILR